MARKYLYIVTLFYNLVLLTKTNILQAFLLSGVRRKTLVREICFYSKDDKVQKKKKSFIFDILHITTFLAVRFHIIVNRYCSCTLHCQYQNIMVKLSKEMLR